MTVNSVIVNADSFLISSSNTTAVQDTKNHYKDKGMHAANYIKQDIHKLLISYLSRICDKLYHCILEIHLASRPMLGSETAR